MKNSQRPFDQIPQPDIVAVYGTLKHGFGNHRIMQEAGGEFIGNARSVDQFPLVVSGLPYLLDKRGAGHRVCVELYRVASAEGWYGLDCLEGHPNFYCRRVEKFETDTGEVIEAWVYFLARLIRELERLDAVESYEGSPCVR